jgi:acetyl esterase
MTLDPQAKAVLDYLATLGEPDISAMSVQQARALARKRTVPPGPAANVGERLIATGATELRLRLYKPATTADQLGALIFFHGGGFVIGDLDGHDALCRQIAVDARCAVIAVEYRLAPEHKFPCAVDDAYAATCWVHEHAAELGVDPTRLAVGGDSAGGNLAAAVARLVQAQRSLTLRFQLLLYPVTDLRSFDTASYLQNANGMFLTRDGMQWFARHYLRHERDAHDPRASPLCAATLTGVAPALIITAEHDPLRDEGAAYAKLLARDHNQVTLTCYDGMIHGFLSMYSFLDKGQQALHQCTEALSAAFEMPYSNQAALGAVPTNA